MNQESKQDSNEQLCEFHQLALNAFIEMLRLKNYSGNTIRNYRNWFLYFLKAFPGRKPSQITKDETLKFLTSFRNSKSWSATTQNQLINAIKFFSEQVLKRPREMYDLPRAQKPYQLPEIFSASEILAILNACENLKHRTILSLGYACGLRVSELVNLKVSEVDSKRMIINIRQAKGKKDRIVMLSEKLLELFRTYYTEYQPKIWLFEGQTGEQYSSRSIQAVLHHAKEKAGIKKKGSIHALRHSFATHLLESGTDILSIKELLGHNSLRTTMTYTHVSNKHISKIKSPFDSL
jgi:integrase/recombinase XerD